jgi:hypothetical protein
MGDYAPVQFSDASRERGERGRDGVELDLLDGVLARREVCGRMHEIIGSEQSECEGLRNRRLFLVSETWELRHREGRGGWRT